MQEFSLKMEGRLMRERGRMGRIVLKSDLNTLSAVEVAPDHVCNRARGGSVHSIYEGPGHKS